MVVCNPYHCENKAHIIIIIIIIMSANVTYICFCLWQLDDCVNPVLFILEGIVNPTKQLERNIRDKESDCDCWLFTHTLVTGAVRSELWVTPCIREDFTFYSFVLAPQLLSRLFSIFVFDQFRESLALIYIFVLVLQMWRNKGHGPSLWWGQKSRHGGKHWFS